MSPTLIRSGLTARVRSWGDAAGGSPRPGRLPRGAGRLPGDPGGCPGRPRPAPGHPRRRRAWQDCGVGSLMLLDTASLYYRAFYGMPETVTAPDGTPVNAIRGLLDTIARLVRD